MGWFVGSRSSRIYSYPKERSYLNEIMLVSQLLNSEHSDWDIHNLKLWFEDSVMKIFENSNVLGFCQLNQPIGFARWRHIIIMTLFGAIFGKPILHECHKMLIWRIAVDVLPTKANLDRFFEIGDDICPLCKLEVESSIHLFALCPVAKSVWFNS